MYKHLRDMPRDLTEHLAEWVLLQRTLDVERWEVFNDEKRRYACWTVSPRLMYVVIPPGGKIDRHRDVPAKRNRTNAILRSNSEAFFNIASTGGIYDSVCQCLETGGTYGFDANLEHWVENNGPTDVIIMVYTQL